MEEDSMFSGDYDSLCPLCNEEGETPCLALEVNQQERNVNAEDLKRDHAISYITEMNKETVETVTKGFVELDEEYNNEDTDFKMGESKVEINKRLYDGKVCGEPVPLPQEVKSVLCLDSSSPVNLMMVCKEPVEDCANDELLLCPAKPLTHSQTALILSPSQNPLALTLPLTNSSMLQLQTQPVVQTQVSEPQSPCLAKPAYKSSPSVEPKTVTHSGQLEVTLQQVYATRRYTRFSNRPAQLKSLHPETSSQPLPCVSNTSLLAPAPKKKTRTSYSTDQLEELERMFQDDHYPDAEKRKEIAISVGVTPQRVMVWFQNRRAKWRKTSKATTRKPPVARTQAVDQAPVHRPVFKGPMIAPLPLQTGNTLPAYSSLHSSCKSPTGCVDVTTTLPLENIGDCKHPLMHSPPPLRRASLPFFAAYNPPTHTLSVLLDTPEHSEPQPFSMHTDTGFSYDSVGASTKYESLSSCPGSTQPYQLMTCPQPSSTLLPQQSALLPQQSKNVLPQQSNTLMPQYSRVSYLTPSPYLTPNSSEGTATTCMSLNPGNGSNLLPCTNGGPAYFQCQNSSQILLQPGLQALQSYPWTGDLYGHSGQVPHAVLKHQFSSHGSENHYPLLGPSQSYITPRGASCPTMAKPATPDPLLASVKAELEEAGHSQSGKLDEAETIFHCDFSPIHF